MPVYKEKVTRKRVVQEDFSGRRPKMIIHVVQYF